MSFSRIIMLQQGSFTLMQACSDTVCAHDELRGILFLLSASLISAFLPKLKLSTELTLSEVTQHPPFANSLHWLRVPQTCHQTNLKYALITFYVFQ